jgi:hypothetical protein
MTYHEAMSQPVRPNPVVEAYKRDIDRTLIREKSQAHRRGAIPQAMALASFADELRRAGREARSKKP